jgi:hypothetical protein
MAMLRAFVSFRSLCFLGWVLAWPAAPAQAHEVKEMTISARLHADRTDLVVVASNHLAATILAGPGGRLPVLNAETFATLHPALEEQGKNLCTLATGENNARALAPTALDVLLGQDGEVEFFLAYPPVTDGTLRLEAVVLARLEPGYVVNLKVLDTKRRLLAAKALTRGDAGVTVPSAGQTTEKTPD